MNCKSTYARFIITPEGIHQIYVHTTYNITNQDKGYTGTSCMSVHAIHVGLNWCIEPKHLDKNLLQDNFSDKHDETQTKKKH